MKKRIECVGDTEIIWLEGKPESEPTHIIVFNQEEQGFASFGVGMGLIGDEKPIAKIFSKLFSIPAFNEIPDPLFPEWRLYEKRADNGDRFFILRIIHFHPTMLGADAGANNYVWLYSYPIIRDIITSLNDCGVNQSTFLTSDTMSIFTPHQGNDLNSIAVFDYMNSTEEPMSKGGVPVEGDIVCTPPAWIWSCIFKNFCTLDDVGCWIVFSKAPDTFLDRDGVDLLLEYVGDVLGLSYNESELFSAIDTLATMESFTDGITLDRFMASGFFENDSNGGMFG